MWSNVAQIILRWRILILILLAGITVFFGFMATSVKIDNKFANMLPESHSSRIDHERLKEMFGGDGNVMILGVKSDQLFQKDHFNSWYRLGRQIREVEGVDSVFSAAHLYQLRKDSSEKKFQMELVSNGELQTQKEVDSVASIIKSLPIYKGMILNDSANFSLMMIFFDGEKFDSQERAPTVENILKLKEEYASFFPEAVVSGLPYIREEVAKSVKGEMGLFVGLALGITGLILLIFFRSIKVVAICLTVVSVGVVWCFGTIGLLGFKMSIMMGVIPPLIIVIGIPNCIFLLNKYHSEFKSHGNKAKALVRVIQKIGNATFMTNTTTALGFGTFMFTSSKKLQEFGLVASINILAIFLISLCMIPIIYSFLKPPEKKHMRHLEKKWLDYTITRLVKLVENRRPIVYVGTILIVLLALFGMSKMQVTGNISSDLPSGNHILGDLKTIERNFGGVVPFEIIIDTKKKGKYKKLLNEVESVQNIIAENPLFSKSMSIADAAKFANQAFNDGDESKYKIPSRNEFRFISKYIGKGGDTIQNKFLDTSQTITRISVNVTDVGSKEMQAIIDDLRMKVDSVFNPNRKALEGLMKRISSEKSQNKKDTLLAGMYNEYPYLQRAIVDSLTVYNVQLEEQFYNSPDLIFEHHKKQDFIGIVNKKIEDSYIGITFTGVSVLYAQSTKYLIRNLIVSLCIAIVIIAIIMALLFNSWKMVIVSLVPNFIPLLLTAGIMGYLGIAVKPSTVLIFSIAVGISIDDTIHYLAKYRQELKLRHWDIRGSAIRALKETGISMIYTSIVLFFGFSIFTTSSFGGTVALGALVSITLLVAMFSNLIVLPTLLLSLDKSVTNKAFKEPLLEIIDEEEDIELEELIVQNLKDQNKE